MRSSASTARSRAIAGALLYAPCAVRRFGCGGVHARKRAQSLAPAASLLASVFFFSASIAWAQPGGGKGDRKLRAWFPDAGVEFSTETTGATESVSSGGSILVNDMGVLRIVADKNGHVLYAYGVEASAGPLPDTVTIRIKPLEPKAAQLIRERNPPGRRVALEFPSGAIPTLAAAREFPGVKKGEAVRLEILYNPSTGEKVYDILRPSTEPRPGEKTLADSAPAHEEFSFREISIKVNGIGIPPPGGWLTGAVARLYLPNRGAYFLAAYAPATPQPFRHMLYADGHNLEFAIDGDDIRIASAGNILTLSESGVLWIYHDPKYQPASHPEEPQLAFADKAESLLPAMK